MPTFRYCDGCDGLLDGEHVRVQIAMPKSSWRGLRFHTADCIDEWLDKELADGATPRTFTRPEWRTRAKG